MAKYNNEVLVVRVEVINHGDTIRLEPRFRELFHAEFIAPGVTFIRYPIKDTRLQALVTQCEQTYSGLEFNVGASAIEEY